FFFQAEDGIRDPLVTGVQTCALPICRPPSPRREARRRAPTPCRVRAGGAPTAQPPAPAPSGRAVRRRRPRRRAARGGTRSTGRQIGRASCRARGEMYDDVGAFRNTEQ